VDALREAVAEVRERLMADEPFAAAEADLAARINEDVLASALAARPRRVPPRAEESDDADGPQVIYVGGGTHE
jgi:hypothetical protein